MSARPVPVALQQLPNALTVLSYAAIPLFVWLYVDAGDGPAWWAGIVFAAAAATDQLDGWLARRWRVESPFGKVADPLADRLMIGVAVVLLWADGRLPWPAAVIVLARDLLLVAGYKLVVPRGYDFEVSFLGKAATWILYFSLACVIVTEKGTTWPLVLFWVGVCLAVAAGAQYLLKARREVRRG
jgi:CDP-diacylglycerol--glycerol-3-phosphate 3-phosphatidyltransferase